MWENIFRPESNQTLSRFKFRGLKQCQSQSCDAYMAELCLNIVECKYPNTVVQDELLKDQFIFGVCIKEGAGPSIRLKLLQMIPKKNAYLEASKD